MPARLKSIAVAVALAAGPAAPAAPARAAFTVAVPQAAPADTTAGAHSDFTLALTFAGGDVRDLDIGLPAGLVGDPHATPACPADAFRGGTCDQATRLGDVQAVVAALGLPLTENGEVYNLAPHGAELARLGLTLRPVAGLLGLVTTEIAVTARPADAGLDAAARVLPNTVAGLDLDLRSLRLELDGLVLGRPFMRNPTSCATAMTTVTATSAAGERAYAEASFTPTACERTPFDPRVAARIGARGSNARRGHPPLQTVITQGAGEAAIRRVEVALPSGVSADLQRLSRACPEAALDAGACPPASTIGTAAAVTPLLAGPLAGPVRLVAPAAGGLPQVDLDLRGAPALRLRGTTAITGGRLVTAVDGLPDVPLSRLQLDFAADGVLSTATDLCAATGLRLDAALVSAGGARRQVRVTPVVDGCAGTVGWSGRLDALRRGRTGLTLRADARGAAVRRLTVALPAALTVRRGVRPGDVDSTPAAARVRVRRHEVRLTLPGDTDTAVRVRVPRWALTVAAAARRRRAARLRVRAAVELATGGTVRRTLVLRLPPA